MTLSIETILVGHGLGGGQGISPPVVSVTEPTTGLSDGLYWYNPETEQLRMYIDGSFQSIGSHGVFLSKFTGSYTISNITNEVPIVLDDTVFVPKKDFLIVSKNTTSMTEGIDYVIEGITGAAKIRKLTGNWDAGTVFSYEALISTSIPKEDGLMMGVSETRTSVGAGETNIPFNIHVYNPAYDLLRVYTENLEIFKGHEWNLNPNGVSIDLTYETTEETTFHFVVWKKIRDGFDSNVIDGSLLMPGTVSQDAFSPSLLSDYYLDKDTNGYFQTTESRRLDNTLFLRSEAANPNENGQYETVTITRFDTDGVTVTSTHTVTLSYDADGDIVSRVVT